MSTPDPATTYWIPLAGGGGGDVSSAVIKAPDTSARNLIQPTLPAVKPLCIKAAALQTANLFEWQNNAGTVLGYVKSDGQLVPTTMQIGGDGGVWSRILANLTQYAGNLLLNVNPRNAFALSFASPDNPGGQGAALLVRGDGKMEWSNGDQLFDVSLYRPAANWLQVNGSFQIVSPGAANPGIVVKAAASQSASIQEWQNSAGAVLAYVRNDGSLYAPNILAAPNFDLRGSSDIYVSSDTGTVNLRNFNGPAGLTLLQNMRVAIWNGILEFGPNPTSDTWFQRTAAGQISVYDYFRVNKGLEVNLARSGSQVTIWDDQVGASQPLRIIAEGVWPNNAVEHYSSNPGAVFEYIFTRSRGTFAAPTGIKSGDYLAGFGFRGFYGAGLTSNQDQASFRAQATEDWTASAMGTAFVWFTTPRGSAVAGGVVTHVFDGGESTAYRLRAGFSGNLATEVPMIVRGTSAQSADLQQWQDVTAAWVARVDKSGTFITRANAAPADAGVNANEMALWFDPTNAAPKFVLKAKTADGTVKTLTIPFSPSGTVFNVYKRPEDFGPVGTTNDLPVVQAAVNASANGGCCLLSRRYVCNGPLVVPTGASILGTGPGAMLDFLNCNGLVLDDCNWMGCIEYSGFYIRGRNATDTGAVTTGNFAAIYHPGNTTKPSSGGGLFGGASFSNLFFDSWGWAFRANALWRCEIRHCGGYDLYNGIECKGQSLLLNVYANRFERGSFGGKPPSGYTEGIGYYCGALTYATGGVGPPESMHVYHNMFYGFEVGIYNEHGLYHCFEFNDLDFSTKVGFRYRESMHQLVIRGHYIAMNGSSGTLVGIEGIDISSGGYVSEGSAIIEENEIWGYPSGTATCIGIRMGSTQSNAKINKNYLNGNNGGDISLLGSNANVTINDNVLDSTAPTNSFIAATGTSGEFARNKIAKPVSVNAGSTFVLHSQSGAGADAAAEGWRTISSFGAGWSAAAGYTAPRYRLVPGRKVELSGRANGASSAALAVAFTNLPAAFRPPLERAMPAMGNDQYAIVAVTNTGDIYLKSPSAQFTNMNLDSVSYSLV